MLQCSRAKEFFQSNEGARVDIELIRSQTNMTSSQKSCEMSQVRKKMNLGAGDFNFKKYFAYY